MKKQKAVRRILKAIGENPNRDGLLETPERVVRSWDEFYAGYKTNPKNLLKQFKGPRKYDEIILLKDIEFYSMCEHHMVPFLGRAHIAYIPGKKLLGVSKLARLLDVYARRLQIQERIGEQVTHFLMKKAGASAAACLIEARHLCVCGRGVGKQHSIMVTSSTKGAFRKDPSTKAELMAMIGRN